MKPTLEDVRRSLLEANIDGKGAMLRDRVASDPELLELLTAVGMDNVMHLQTWRVFTTAFTYVLARREPEMLRAASSDPPGEAQYPSLRRLFLRHQDEIVACLERPNQTSLPVRSAALFPALCEIATELHDPDFGLVELGPSIGFNLCLDLYEYDYGPLGIHGFPGSRCRIPYGLVFGPEWAGVPDERPDLSRTLKVVARLGLEKSPVDWNSASSLAWARAFAAPNHDEPVRIAVLEAALAIRSSVPIDMVHGNAIDTLPDAIERVPRDAVVCILESFMLYQVPGAERDRLFSTLRAISSRRVLFLVSLGRFTMRGPSVTITRYDRGHAARRSFAYCCSGGVGIGTEMALIPPLRMNGDIYHPFMTRDQPDFPL